MKQKQIDPYEKPNVFTTFRDPGYAVRNAIQIAPSVWNGVVSVHQYVITVERMEEPLGVITARLQKLWDESDNHHHWGPLQDAAKRIGMELTGRPGDKRKKS